MSNNAHSPSRTKTAHLAPDGRTEGTATGRRTPGRLRLSRPSTTQPPEARDVGGASPSPTPAQNDEASAQGQLLFTADQAAQMLQVRPSWLRRRAAARSIPCRFLGKHLRFAREDIDQIADASRQDVQIGPRVTRSGKTSPLG
jgi:hypothetical protein